ncbi:MAG TPA: zf-HC2 domain-containing protein [Candidatus Acidoferrales bacterium]|nr:zf-HC2 domain-containing protein [Candidatus Acidoferrales bacterium]
MEWTCTLTEERLSDFLEGQLSNGESAALEAHREHCARCTDLVDRMRDLLTGMHGLEFVEEPAHLQARILDATLGPRPKKEGWRRWFAWMPMLWRPRFAIGLATVAACGLIVIQAGGVLPTKMHKANVNPTDIVRSINRQAHLTYAQGVRFVNNLRVVYEIESRLDSQNPQQQSPAQPGQNNLERNQNNPQEKSDRSQTRNRIVYADSDAGAASESSAPAGQAVTNSGTSLENSSNLDLHHSQPKFETRRDRWSSPENLRFAYANADGQNLNQGFPAPDDPDASADGQAKPEWSAP